MKYIYLTLVLSFSLFSCGQLKDVVNQFPQGPISEAEISSGLRQALDFGIDKQVTKLAEPDGFFKNELVRILLPEELQKVDKTLRDLGLDNLADEGLKVLNRAAEDAVKHATPIFVNAVKEISFTDARDILLGKEDAATQYLTLNTRNELYAKFNPVIKQSFQEVGADKIWEDLINKYNAIPLTRDVNPDLTDYVTGEALEGVFTMIALEEKRYTDQNFFSHNRFAETGFFTSRLMDKKLKIAVVGPIPNDTIKTYKGETLTKYGCVTHPTIALAKLLNGIGEVIPVAHVHKKDRDGIVKLFNDYKNIDTSGIYSDKDQGTDIELVFLDQNNRVETQLSNMSPITVEDIKPFMDVDCFVFVPITDFEIELDSLKYIKSHSSAPIVFDAHGPTTFVTPTGKRHRQYWRDIENWLPNIDVLKMNLEESQCSWFDKEYNDDELYDEDNTDHLDAFAEYALEFNLTALYITLDSRGCVIYTKNDGIIKKDFVKSIPVKDVIDTTGCGDSFAGGLAFGLSKYNDLIKAAHFANALGALRTQGKGFDVFKSLADTEKLISSHY